MIRFVLRARCTDLLTCCLGRAMRGLHRVVQRAHALGAQVGAVSHGRGAEHREQGDEAEQAAQGSTVNDLLVKIAGQAPLGALGFLFVALGAVSMGLVELSVGATGG